MIATDVAVGYIVSDSVILVALGTRYLIIGRVNRSQLIL